MEYEFVSGLSESSRYFRFMNALRELSPSMLARFTQVDYDRELALVAVHEVEGKASMIGVARYIMGSDQETAEFAVEAGIDLPRFAVTGDAASRE